MYKISFPGLGLNNITVNPVAFSIGDFGIKWYGIIIAVGLLLALIYGMKRSKEFNITIDDLSDVVIFSIIFGVIGARLYFVLFYSDGTGVNPYFTDPLSIINIRNGGLGIYGGIIASFTTAFIVCKIKKISTGAIFDIAALGFLIGQAIGRWGNYINQEAYGSATTLPWGMVVSSSTNPVHPCFLYESLWCILGFILLHTYSKHRKFNGEVFLMYTAWYAFGRFFIEGLRTDSLMLGNLKISQLVASIFFVASVSLLIYKRVTVKALIEEQTAEYNPLFDEASKAVEEETANVEEEYELDDADDSLQEATEKTEQPQDEDAKAGTDTDAEKKTDGDNGQNTEDKD